MRGLASLCGQALGAGKGNDPGSVTWGREKGGGRGSTDGVPGDTTRERERRRRMGPGQGVPALRQGRGTGWMETRQGAVGIAVGQPGPGKATFPPSLPPCCSQDPQSCLQEAEVKQLLYRGWGAAVANISPPRLTVPGPSSFPPITCFMSDPSLGCRFSEKSGHQQKGDVPGPAL